MTAATARADLSVIKARQQKTWASGDYAVVASRILLTSELLADAADLQAGWEVLDVACGNGNATLAAARSGTHATGIDYVPGDRTPAGQAGQQASAARTDLDRAAAGPAGRLPPRPAQSCALTSTARTPCALSISHRRPR